MRLRFAAIMGLTLALVGCGADPTPAPRPACPTEAPTSVSAQAALQDAELATITVTGAIDGAFTLELYGEAAPIATANFVALARCGFYDGIKFHRVLAGFVVQAGDPGTRDHEGDFDGIGTGGPGYRFQIEPPADGLDYEPYSVSMANDQVANGSQFFVAVADLRGGLPRAYTVFGQVVSGTDTVDAIAGVPVNDPRVGVPLDPVTISSIVVSAAAED
jgi:cyclophilin family peptidyl-prolyl cis-trans isomerase